MLEGPYSPECGPSSVSWLGEQGGGVGVRGEASVVGVVSCLKSSDGQVVRAGGPGVPVFDAPADDVDAGVGGGVVEEACEGLGFGCEDRSSGWALWACRRCRLAMTASRSAWESGSGHGRGDSVPSWWA